MFRRKFIELFIYFVCPCPKKPVITILTGLCTYLRPLHHFPHILAKKEMSSSDGGGDILHQGSCHCGAVRFHVWAPQDIVVVKCEWVSKQSSRILLSFIDHLFMSSAAPFVLWNRMIIWSFLTASSSSSPAVPSSRPTNSTPRWPNTPSALIAEYRVSTHLGLILMGKVGKA